MPRLDVVIEAEVSQTIRAKQLRGMFDVPDQKKQRLEWHVDAPIDEFDWNVGLIVGPSGSGKTTCARALFGDDVDRPLTWKRKSVVDDFASKYSMEEIADVCRAVGFNTIPAWLRRYEVLSNGEKFRVELARRLLEVDDPIVVDEFSSVVDRQVGKIASYAVQKYVRKNDRKFVAVTCHHDAIDWLQPDWVFSPAEGKFVRRSLQQRTKRPTIEIEIARVERSAWRIFAPFHYLTASLHKGARCYGLWANGTLAAFSGFLHRPRSSNKANRRPIMGLSRTVVLPDWQGLGLVFVLNDHLAAAWKSVGKRVRTYPAHPALIRGFDRSQAWKLIEAPGGASMRRFGSSSHSNKGRDVHRLTRQCAVFEYCGKAMKDADLAQKVLAV